MSTRLVGAEAKFQKLRMELMGLKLEPTAWGLRSEVSERCFLRMEKQSRGVGCEQRRGGVLRLLRKTVE